MGLAIYQIGDLPIFFDLKEVNDDALSIKAEREWRNAKLDFTGVAGSHNFNDPLRPLAEQQTISLSGTFVCDENSAQAMSSRLLSMGGIANTPIIGFRYEECDHSDAGVCCSNCNNTLDWIVNYGIITKIDPDVTFLDGKRPWVNSIAPVKITMLVGTKWRALNAWEWEYRNTSDVLNPLNPNLTRNSSDNLFNIPAAYNSLKRTAYFFKWGLELSKYDPTFWEDKYDNPRLGGYGLGYRDLGSYPFVSDPNLWSAAPNSVYAFTNFTGQSGTISIDVTRNAGYFSNTGVTETSSLDLAVVHSDLEAIGEGGLFGSDTIITGYASPFPGFVIRNNEIIANIRPRWSYPGSYPGETGRGYNNVVFSANGVVCQAAFLHDFGTY